MSLWATGYSCCVKAATGLDLQAGVAIAMFVQRKENGVKRRNCMLNSVLGQGWGLQNSHAIGNGRKAARKLIGTNDELRIKMMWLFVYVWDWGGHIQRRSRTAQNYYSEGRPCNVRPLVSRRSLRICIDEVSAQEEVRCKIGLLFGWTIPSLKDRGE